MEGIKRPLFWVFTIALLFQNYGTTAQKILAEQETQWVLEAQRDLQVAISNPEISEAQRLNLIERGARTLKQYGQPPLNISENFPLRDLMEANYKLSQKQVVDANHLYLKLNEGLLKQKMKLINSMQIEVAGEQIKMLIPGVTPIDLSSDVVSTVFGWNIVEGVNQGAKGDAKDLKNKFKQLAKAKKLIQKLEELEKYQRESMRKLYEDLVELDELEKKMISTYNMAKASTSTFKGYEGAELFESGSKNQMNPNLIGTWVYENIGFYVTHTYNSDGTCYIKVNNKQNTFQWETTENLITYTYKSGKKKTMGFRIEGRTLYYTTKRGKISGHPMTKR